MQTLSIISFMTAKLEEYTEALKDIMLHFDTTLAAGLTIGAFVVGCLMISIFANK